MEKDNSIQKSTPAPVFGAAPQLYQKYKTNKQQADSGFQMNVVEFMETYKKNVENYNNYGLDQNKTKDQKEKEFLRWDGRRDD